MPFLNPRRGQGGGPTALPGFRAGGRESRAVWGLCLWLCLLGSLAGPLRAGVVSHEYPLKAIFLLNFAQFTAWPTNVLGGPTAPFVIGVLGTDPFGDALDEAVRGENWNGHPIVVERYQRLEDLQTCHVLYISDSEARRLNRITAAMKGKPVLTVADSDVASTGGIIVKFVTENNKIRFKVDLDSLQESNLSMSSKLLRVAEIAPPAAK